MARTLFAGLNPQHSLKARVGLVFGSLVLGLSILISYIPVIITALYGDADSRHLLAEHQILMTLLSVALGMLAAVIGWLLAGYILKPLTQLAQLSLQIDAAEPHQIPVLSGKDELSQLSRSLYELVQDLYVQRDVLNVSSAQLITGFNEMMATEQALRESEERFRLLVENVTDYAIFLLDTEGQIVSWNAGAERITGYKADEIIGQPVTVFYPRESLLVYKPSQNLEEVIKSGKHEDESWRVRKDGSRFWANVVMTALRDESGTLRGFAKIIRDMTERKQAEIRLQQVNADLERRVQERTADLQERNEDLDAFAHTAAHDLKHPIQVVLGYAGMLQDDYDTISEEDYKLFVAEIMDAGRRMVNIINELLLLAQLRQAEVDRKPVNMTAVVSEVQKRLSSMIKSYSAQIILPDEWPTALGHAPWIEEVWANYLSNGLKYGGKPPCLELGAELLGNNRVRFWIRDNGNGLSAEQQSSLFTQFTRVNTIRVEGHGLGLSVVKRIVEKLGGQVGVESEVGRGSTFSFTLPVA